MIDLRSNKTIGREVSDVVLIFTKTNVVGAINTNKLDQGLQLYSIVFVGLNIQQKTQQFSPHQERKCSKLHCQE